MKYLIILIFSFFCIIPPSSAQWVQLGSDIDGEAIGDNSGSSVSISSDGTRVAIGARHNDGNGNNAGHVRVYENQIGNWVQIGSDIDGDFAENESGRSVFLNSDGTILAIGSPFFDWSTSDAGYVKIYQFIANSWVQIGNTLYGEEAGDQFGYSISLSSNGMIIAIGARYNDGNAYNSGQVKVFQYNGVNWVQMGNNINGEEEIDESGVSVSINSNGTILAIGTPGHDGIGQNSGYVRVYKYLGGNWIQMGNNIEGENNDDQSGWSVSLNSMGTLLAIGANLNDDNGNYSGQVRVYDFSDGINWVQIGNDINGEAAGDMFGYSVKISSFEPIVAIGSLNNNLNSISSGQVRVFEFNGSDWLQVNNDINGETSGDCFGGSISLNSDGTIVAIGAAFNDGIGINAGHVRVFHNCKTTSNINITTCNNYTSPSGNYLWTSSGFYTDTIPNSIGCDSIIKISLIIFPIDTTIQLIDICLGNVYDFYGTLLSTNGTYFKSFISSHGCDSVIKLILSINPIDTSYQTISICQNSNYSFYGTIVTTSGTYYHTLISSHGCDSVIIANIIVNPFFTLFNPQTICNGSAYILNGHTYTNSGNYIDTLTTILGCDSIISTQLTVNSSFAFNSAQTICNGESVIFNGNTYSISGEYYDSLTTVLGCDSVISLSLIVYPIDTIFQSNSICHGNSYDFYGTILTSSGTFYHTLVSTHGCDSVIANHLTVNPLPIVSAGTDTNIYTGTPLQLNASGGVFYEWNPSTFLNNTNTANPISTPLNNISYIVIITDLNGCTDTDTINIVVNESNIWIPNVFNPSNPDPLNQAFYIRGKGIKNLEIVVYDRWGEKLFETNNIEQGWDGTFNGEKLSTGVFVYYVKATFFSGKQIERKGDITLIR